MMGFVRNLPNFLPATSGGGGGGSGVTQIVAGTNVTISPLSGEGVVTINASGGSAPPEESFCAVLGADFQINAIGYIPVAGWATSPDNVSFPELSDQTVYDNLTAGSFNTLTGVFTCGTSGDYEINFAYSTGPAFDGGNGFYLEDITDTVGIFATDSNIVSQVCRLIAGHEYQLFVWLDGSNTPPYVWPFVDSTVGINWPSLFWGCALVGSGGGSGGGQVDSVVAGDYINVDSTDPANPVVSNGGVWTVQAGANVSVDSTDPNNPVISATPGGVVTEAFNLILSGNFPVPASPSFTPMTNVWTNILDIGTFGTVEPQTVFTNFTNSSFDFATGEYTVGTTGVYETTLTIINNYVSGAGLSVDIENATTGLHIASQSIASGSNANVKITQLTELTAGDVIRCQIINGGASTGNIPYVSTSTNLTVPNMSWSMQLTEGGSSGVESVVAGAGINVDNTDARNPVVSVAALLGPEGFAAFMPIGVTGVTSATTITGNWSIGATGGFTVGGGWNGSTGVYTVVTSGYHQVHAHVIQQTGMDAFYIRLNGAIMMSTEVGGVGTPIPTLSAVGYATAGQTIDIAGIGVGGASFDIGGTVPTNPPSGSNYGNGTWFSVWRLG